MASRREINTLPSHSGRGGEASTAAPLRQASPAPSPASQPSQQQQQQPTSIAVAMAGLSDTDDLLAQMKARAYARSQEARSKPSSMASPGKKAPRTPPPRTGAEPAPRAQTPEGPRPPSDATLACARIAESVAQFDSLTASLRSSLNGRSQEEPRLRCVVRNLTVGRATSSASSPLSVYDDRIEYKFHHASQGAVSMLMWYKDFDQAALETLTFNFHVARPLTQHFSGEYDCGRAGDALSMTFCSREDAGAFLQACSVLSDRSSWPRLK
ncbi:hypothetical protein FOA52_012262 [Chlamydomonas sp. UWO 241]|nr:hypothetical protein FOA52_012262 [Chlamydomonas sp. UWO 241]